MAFTIKRFLVLHNIDLFDEVETNFQSEYSPQDFNPPPPPRYQYEQNKDQLKCFSPFFVVSVFGDFSRASHMGVLTIFGLGFFNGLIKIA